MKSQRRLMLKLVGLWLVAVCLVNARAAGVETPEQAMLTAAGTYAGEAANDDEMREVAS